jgi:hypothetical protein
MEARQGPHLMKGEEHSLSVFFRLDENAFHTYSVYARDTESLIDAYMLGRVRWSDRGTARCRTDGESAVLHTVSTPEVLLGTLLLPCRLGSASTSDRYEMTFPASPR